MAKIVLTESELKTKIAECINEALQDEGLWNQVKQGAKSFFGNGYGADKEDNFRNTTADRQARGEHTANWLNKNTPMNLKQRWNAAKTGFKEQGTVDNVGELNKSLDYISSFFEKSKAKNKPELMNAVAILKKYGSTIANGANGRISKANNDIYKGMETGVTGTGKQTTV